MNSNLRRWAALVVVCFGQLMIMLESTIVNVALPFIQRDLGFSQANLTWVVNGYLIAYGSFLLLAGRIGDLIGRRKVFLAGVFLFTVASVGTGLAPAADNFVIGRFLQGLGASLSAGVIIAIIVTEFQKPAERAQAMSVLTLIFGAWLIEENEGLGSGQGVDVAGAILITAALMLSVYTIVTAADQGWTSVHTLGVGGVAIGLLALFVLLESRIKNPLMPLRVLAIRSLAGASGARTLLFTGLFTNFFVGALYLQHLRGYAAFETGLAFLPTTLMIGVMSTGVAARLMARFGPRRLLVVGMTIIVTALAMLSSAGLGTSYAPWLLIAYALLGAGGGMSFLPLLTISMSDVPMADAGLASGFSNATMQVGGALGLAAMGTVSSAHAQALMAAGDPASAAVAGGFQLAYVLAAICVAAGLAVVLGVLRPSVVARRSEIVRAEME